MVPASPRLLVRDLRTPVLRGVSLEVAGGEIVCLQGASGAGKSRLVRAICDLDASTGEVTLDGVAREAIPAPRWRRAAAMLPTDSAWWTETVSAHFPAPPPYPLERLGLDPALYHQPVTRLSSGERQRLALLRVLALGPRILLLDEPTANLDAANRERMERLIRSHVEERGTGVLWITHDDEQARRVGDRILHMDAGKVA